MNNQPLPIKTSFLISSWFKTAGGCLPAAYIIAVLFAVRCTFKEVVMRREMLTVVRIDTVEHWSVPMKKYYWVDNRGGLLVTTMEPMGTPFTVGYQALSFIRE